MRSKEDRRVTHVWLTPKANRIRAGLLKLARSINMQAEQGIPREDIAVFRQVILQMTANLDRVGQ
jgi:DNA-binding MarR family transcriptional regulator